MKLNNCFLLAEDGTTIYSANEAVLYKRANPNAFTVTMGHHVQIHDQKMLSYGNKGTIVGFDRNSSGNVLCLVQWLEGAAPLRVRIEALKPKPPAKFWMVIPMERNPTNSMQSSTWGGSERRRGFSPGVHRFATRELAEQYIRTERTQTGFQTYVLLESTHFFTATTTEEM